MSNNYQPQSGGFGSLINSGLRYPLPTPNSPDAALLNQQEVYAQLCNDFIGRVSRVRADGKNISTQVQKRMLTTVANTPMTVVAAQTYFPGVRTDLWSSGVIDYKLALQTITSLTFPSESA